MNSNVKKSLMHTKREIRNALRRELKQYEACVGELTPGERKELHKWVAGGNSVYDNAYWLAGEDGNSLCFIATIRLVTDILNHPKNYSS